MSSANDFEVASARSGSISGVETLWMRRGALHIPHTVYDRYFAKVSGLLLMLDGDDMLVLPVRLAGSGGFVVKIRNAAGDRVIEASDFCRVNGLDAVGSFLIEMSWETLRGGLVSAGFLTANPASSRQMT